MAFASTHSLASHALRRRLAIPGMAVAAAALLAGVACSATGPADGGDAPIATEQTALTTTLSAEDLVAEAGPSVVRVETGSGVGTGFVISEDGYIVTNNHVIEGNGRVATAGITVTLADGTELPATVVGADPKADLAVLKVERTGLDPLPLASGDSISVGEDVLAIGYALDLGGGDGAAFSVSRGIVSAINRAIENDGGAILGAIQTDAAVNHGNSGGPLLSFDGEVIGVVTSLVPDGSTGLPAQGVALAVGADTVRAVVDEIVATGSVQRAVLGIGNFHALTPAEAAERGLDPDAGGVVIGENGVVAGGAADRAGIEPGDVLLSLDGEPVGNETGLAVALIRLDPGDTVTAEVYHDGATHTVDIAFASQQA